MATYPPLLPATTRFFQPEVSKVYYLPTIAATNLTPTRAEMTAGTNLTKEIADLAGWTIATAMINTPDLGAKFVSQIGGRLNAEASSLTFYADKTGNDVRLTLPRGTTGYIMFCDGGDVPAQPADVFKVEVTSLGKVRSTADNALVLTVSFAITAVPAENVVIPANP